MNKALETQGTIAKGLAVVSLVSWKERRQSGTENVFENYEILKMYLEI